MDWFLYVKGLHHERVKAMHSLKYVLFNKELIYQILSSLRKFLVRLSQKIRNLKYTEYIIPKTAKNLQFKASATKNQQTSSNSLR